MNQKSWKPYIKRNAGIFVAGIVLQLLWGDLDNSLLRYPVGAILAVVYVYVLYLIYSLSEKRPVLKSLFDFRAMTSAMIMVIALVILFGLIRQSDEHAPVVFTALGFTRMTNSWIFCLFFVHFNSILGLQVMDDLSHFRTHKNIQIAAHLCVFVILTTALFGNGDKMRIRVTAQLNEPTQTGIRDGQDYLLPFSITLQRFTLEQYPPKIYIVTAEPGMSKDFITLDDSLQKGQIGKWDINIDKYIASALPDSIDGFKSIKHVGTAPVALVTVTHKSSGEKQTGWVTPGSFLMEPRYLKLDDHHTLIMAEPQAKRYCSDISVTQSSQNEQHFQVEVNHPARLGPWRIYQVGYDTELGEWSRSSTLECVRDRGYRIIHVALWTLLAISLLMFVRTGRFFKRHKK